MSIKVMTAVWDHSRHKGSALLLLLALADFAHDDGSSIFPSVKRMTEKTRLSERAVQYILRDLVASGELVEDGKHDSGTTRYRVDLVALGANFAPRANGAPGGAKKSDGGVQPIAPDPSLNRYDPSVGITPEKYRRFRDARRPGRR